MLFSNKYLMYFSFQKLKEGGSKKKKQNIA